MQLVALTGAKQSGKSTAAKIFVDEYGFVRLRFAEALKNMLRVLGVTEAQLDGDEKESPCELLGGKTARYAMITLGTSWGREIIGGDLWVRVMRNEIVRLMILNPDVKIVVDDTRHPNEYTMLVSLGAKIHCIRRPSVETIQTRTQKFMSRFGVGPKVHSSETYWHTFRAHSLIVNNRTEASFKYYIRQLAEEYNHV